MNQFSFTSESTLAAHFDHVIQPFWQQQVVQGLFKGVADIDIAYAYVVHPKAIGSVVIVSGRIESLLKYKEFVFDIYQQGYSVFIHDHRGQGLSGRMTQDPQMGFVHSFDDYVADCKTFMHQVVNPLSRHKASLICHSMGGAIGTLLVLDSPHLFKNIILSAPMFGIKPTLPSWLAHLLLKSHALLSRMSGKEINYFFGQKGYSPNLFADNELTHSAIRYQLFRQEYEALPQLKLGGVTGHWLAAAIVAMDKIEQQVKEFPIPALVLQAGGDTVVDNTRQARVANDMPHVKLVVIKDAKHELIAEQDSYRDVCLGEMLTFIQQS
ncbi:alpha/beta fold hydrolase [Paraglaciecola aquimarina]|uniref:Alpha/beta fold hydrolase n=1 Tax=Paraglaciecola aquimarina TaxID=1235557 RepID=A0ABU3SVQ3_9ALTE|nr:alpha/beta fold hydrolase [Paraglaciecola aquimarina]MDU0354091.1 alpha/beta fold hydrolase [Paraglaciecola aquimarina]